jgi:hypothetical protein
MSRADTAQEIAEYLAGPAPVNAVGRWDGNIGCAEPPHGLFLLRALSTACGTRRGEEGWITWFTIADPAGSAQPPQL